VTILSASFLVLKPDLIECDRKYVKYCNIIDVFLEIKYELLAGSATLIAVKSYVTMNR